MLLALGLSVAGVTIGSLALSKVNDTEDMFSELEDSADKKTPLWTKMPPRSSSVDPQPCKPFMTVVRSSALSSQVQVLPVCATPESYLELTLTL
jgi:hypothetical protein